jgi:hypothetical protein
MMAAAQATIDRARAHARNNLHRATADLSRLQTERCLRARLAPEVPEALVSHQAIAKTLANDTRRRLSLRKLDELDSLEAIFTAAAGLGTGAFQPRSSETIPLQNKPNPATPPPSTGDPQQSRGALDAREGPVTKAPEPPGSPNLSCPLQNKPNFAAEPLIKNSPGTPLPWL